MAEPKTRPTAASVQDFFALQPPARRQECEAIAAMMRKATGEAPELWVGGIVGCGRYLARRADGSAYEWPLLGFAPRKAALSLYLLAGGPQQDALLARLGKHTTGKGCLYVKRLADVDGPALLELMDAAVQALAHRRVRR